LDSGGPLMAEQAAYDVQHVDLNLRVDPPPQSIQGTAAIDVKVTAPLSWLVLDLDRRLTVTAVRRWQVDGAKPLRPFEQRGGKLWVEVGEDLAVGSRLVVSIDYGGRPRVAQHAPWDAAFTWAKTKAGQPWIATAVQGEGADLWWPCKDHPSDKPESVTIRVTVPQPLVVVSNGRLLDVIGNADDTRTYHWHTALPISNYNVALNIAPYETVERDYQSLGGETVRATYWVLPENKVRGEAILTEFLEHLRFYERILGPYPCRREKYGVVETPHLGMEHQSIIAYGNKYQGGPYGYDWLHHHELGHEWWGNLVTASDWSHVWIHEGIGTYMQALYAEEREGLMAYHHAMYESKRQVRNSAPIVPGHPAGAAEMFSHGGQIYFKGSWVIHTLRYLVGKEAALQCLRRFLYPTEESERWGDARAFRLVTTEDFERTVQAVTGRDLRWFFDVYLREKELPKLVRREAGDKLVLEWTVPGKRPFPMPIEIDVDGKIERFDMPDGRLELDAKRYGRGRLDPNFWVLKEAQVAAPVGP
jgi:aminopeptidase N